MTKTPEFEFDILGTKWIVKVGELRGRLGAPKRFGFMNAEDRTLTINEDTHPSWRLYLLLHETLHALIFLGHLQFLLDDEQPQFADESKIDAIASLLADVLNRNNLSNTAALDTPPREERTSVEPGEVCRVSHSMAQLEGAVAIAVKSIP